MLTSDLVRVRTKKGVVIPRYIDPADPALLRLAGRFTAAFRRCVGRPRGALTEAIDDIVGDTPDLILRKGLVKLLEDRATFEVESPVPPVEVRALVFSLAARVHPVTLAPGAREDLLLWSDGGLDDQELVPDVLSGESANPPEAEAGPDADHLSPAPALQWTHRDAVLARAGEQLGISPAQVLYALYADLDEAHVLRAFEDIEPAALLKRYNLGLAQAVLLKATSMEVSLGPMSPARHRQLFRAMKFNRLMYRIEPQGKGGYRLELDGPLSLFKSVSRYGLSMALFLPALIKEEGWSLTASLSWGKGREERRFKLDPSAGLESHLKDQGVYRTQEEAWFVERFEAQDTPWTLDLDPPLLDCGGQDLIVPDVALRHPDGRVAYMEILGFWRRASLLGRVEQLRRARLGHLILAVSKNMQASVEALGEVPAEVVYFRDIIPPKAVIERAEAVARAEEPGPRGRVTGRRGSR